MLGLPEEFTPEFIARLEQLRIKTRREYVGLGKGSHLSPRRGSSLEFSDFRHYSLGDDFRYIDWGLYGRTDKLYIKLFKEEEDLLTYIFIDASASMGFPARDHKFAAAIATALAVAYIALASGDRVMIRVLGGTGSPPAPTFVYGRHRIVELGRVLNAIQPAGEVDLAPARCLSFPIFSRYSIRWSGAWGSFGLPIWMSARSRFLAAPNSTGKVCRATSKWSMRRAASACASRSVSASARNIARRCSGWRTRSSGFVSAAVCVTRCIPPITISIIFFCMPRPIWAWCTNVERG
jgi:hypothetical protein